MSFSPIVVGSGLPAWKILEATYDRQRETFDKSPQISRDVDYFKARIESVETSEQLLDDRRLLRVALGAFGLGDDINNRAYLERVLDSDPNDRSSFANRLGDKRYLAMAKAFGFAGSDGPTITGQQMDEALADELKDVKSPDDLLSDAFLLRSTLKSFGIDAGKGNSFVVENVLRSDLSDPESFANRLGDEKLLALAKALDFAGRDVADLGIEGFVAAFDGRIGSLETADDLLSDTKLLTSALDMFGIEETDTDVLRDVLNSDWTDPDSVAAGYTDKRYRALSAAFNFGGPEVEQTRAERMVAHFSDGLTRANRPDDIVYTKESRETVAAFFDVEEPLETYGIQIVRQRKFLTGILESDPSDQMSMVNLHPDKRFLAMSAAFGFGSTDEVVRTYPEGFAEEITDRFAGRSFEAGVGISDPNLRLALSLEREIGRIADQGGSTNAQWYNVISSPPLRQVFQTVFNLPGSFGTIDVESQLTTFKARSQAQFGTDNVSDFADPDRLEELRKRFLAFSETGGTGAVTGRGSLALAILNGGR